MNNILLDNNVVIDFLSEARLQKYESSKELNKYFTQQREERGRVNFFISASSIDNLEFVLFNELKKSLVLPNRKIMRIVHFSIKDLFERGVKIAKTPAYMEIDYDDIEDSQVLASAKAINAKVITRDAKFINKFPEHVISVEEGIKWLQQPQKQIDFANLKKQYTNLQPEIEQQLDEVLNTTSFVMGSKVKELEEKLQDFTDAKHAITCSSGTDALLLAMMAMDIQPGDEIITTPFTFIATAETIALMKAKPVFVDIDPISYNIDPSKIEAAITEKTKVIMPVSLYGQPADMDEINAIAKKHKLKVIVDGAQSFGATYKDKTETHVCDIYSTSFFPAKPLGCYGDGGAVFTNNDEYAEKIKMLRVHGQNKRYHHKYIGMSGRLDTIQAAVLLAKLSHYRKEIKARQTIAQKYSQTLQSIVQTPQVKTDRTSVWAQYTVRIKNRDKVQENLKQAGIPTAVHYPMPLHLQECFRYLSLNQGGYPVSEQLAKEVLSLPMNPFLTLSEIEYISSKIEQIRE